ncbi:MAG: MerR family transcriptional regulator [Candidatus Methylomirabilales bacterium]
MGERMLGIRQLAREAGVSSKTLRYWETRGLLPPPRRTHTNYRLYGETDLERVLFIRKAQSLGLTLAEIRQVFDLARSRKAPCDAVIRWTGEKVRALKQQIQMLQDLKGRLTRYQRRWSAEGKLSYLDPNEICRCIASVPVQDLRAIRSSPPGKGGEKGGSKTDRKPLPRLRRLSGRRGL